MTSYIAIDSEEGTGSLFYWKASGERGIEETRTQEREAGVREQALPAEPTRAAILRRAIDKAAKGLPGVHLVRPLGKREGRFAVVREDRVGGTVQHVTVFHVTTQEGSAPNIEPRIEQAPSIFAPLMVAAWDHYHVHFTADDIGAWYGQFLRRECDAVRVRDDGGVWYVPPGKDALARAAGRALNGFLGVQRIPVMKAADAVRAIVHALSEDTRKVCEEIEAWVQETTAAIENGDEVARLSASVRKRDERIEELRGRVRLYQSALGAEIGGPLDQLRALQDRLTAVKYARVAVAEGRTATGRVLDLEETTTTSDEPAGDYAGRGPLELE